MQDRDLKNVYVLKQSENHSTNFGIPSSSCFLRLMVNLPKRDLFPAFSVIVSNPAFKHSLIFFSFLLGRQFRGMKQSSPRKD